LEATATAVETTPAKGIGSRTVADLLPLSVRAYADRQAILHKEDGEWRSKTFAEVGDIVRSLALGLVDLGIEPQEKVAILANTRPEWTYCDFAALSVGAVVVPIYQTNSPEECQYVLENSDARVVVVEDAEQLAKVRAVRDRLPLLEHVILIQGADDEAISLADLAARGAGHDDAEWEERWRAVTPDDVCTFIYTSGTTGPPKGCIISHGNYRAMLDMVNEVAVTTGDDLTYLFLPLAHSFALLIQLGSFDLGATLAFWERDPLRIVPNLAEVRPTYFPSVPRIFEKIYTAATASVEKQGPAGRAIFWWSVGVGRRVRERERAGRGAGPFLRLQHALADRMVLSKIRGLFGGRLRLAVSGAAPINPEILRFYDAAGVLVVEGWGMTETSTAATISTEHEFKVGTVGRPFPGCEIRIADDGEVLVRGPNVFQGYYKNPEATAEALVDGWLRTGDVGELDPDGYLRITGRKKDIIITAGGKNITPANIEAEIKQSPLVSQCVVVGDRRPYLVALLTLDAEEVSKLGAEDPEVGTEEAAWPESARLRTRIGEHIDRVNEKLARVEQVKKFAILPHDLSQQAGELTPTMKVKRNVVVERFAAEIDRLYSD
jgi:long-chain acyl-CoA synthetase